MNQDSDGPSLRAVYLELLASYSEMVTRAPLTGRRTKRKAEIRIMQMLYTDIAVVLGRLLVDQVHLTAFWSLMRAGTTIDGAILAEHQAAMAALRVDIFSLYQWAYAVENSIREFRLQIDLSELERLSIFRSKLVVHPATTALHRARDVAGAGTMWHESGERIRILSHPFDGGNLLRGRLLQLRRLERVIPGLREEPNVFEKIDLIYRHYNLIPDRRTKDWVRNKLFDRTGLKSDPPDVVARALLDVLNAFRRRRHA